MLKADSSAIGPSVPFIDDVSVMPAPEFGKENCLVYSKKLLAGGG
jgi:hypothetical protein